MTENKHADNKAFADNESSFEQIEIKKFKRFFFFPTFLLITLVSKAGGWRIG